MTAPTWPHGPISAWSYGAASPQPCGHPAEADRQQWEHDSPNICALATGPQMPQEPRDEKQTSEPEQEEHAHQTRDGRGHAAHAWIVGVDPQLAPAHWQQ